MKFTSPYVNKASNWLIFVKGPIKGFVYIRACEFQYELLNFTTKFGTKFATFAEKLYEINCKAEKTPQHFNASLFVTIWVAVIGSFLTIDARMGRVMKRGVLQKTGPCLQAHYSFLGPARGIPPVKFMTSYETQEYKGFSQPHSQTLS